MHKIGVYLEGKPSNGGSYQFWQAVLKALSCLDRQAYSLYIYAEDLNWEEIATGMENMRFVQVRTSLNFPQKVFHFLGNLLPERAANRLYGLWNPFLRFIRKEGIDLWVAQTVDGPGDCLGLDCMIPIFDLMHRYEKSFQEVAQKYEEREKLYKRQCRYAKIILVDSEVGKQHVLESYGDQAEDLEKRIKVLPFIPPDYIYKTGEIDKLPYEIFDKYIFYPAQFWTHKNHLNLLKAMAACKAESVEVKLILVGTEQNNKGSVESAITELGLKDDVKILGYVKDEEMVYLYRHARALVMPTFFGPTNIPQLEAFELGCPVATSGIYGIPEQVGDAALLFSPSSVEEIAACVKRLWTDDDLCRELIRKGRQRAQSWGQEQFTEKLTEYIDAFFESGKA